MLRRYAVYFSVIRTIADIVIIAFVWTCAYYIRFYSGIFAVTEGIPDIRAHLLLTPLVVFICIATCLWSGLYRSKRAENLFSQILELIKATLLSGLFMLAFLYYSRETPYSRILLAIFIVLLFLGLSLSHICVLCVLKRLRKKGHNLRHYIIIGAGEKAQQLVRDIETMPWLGLKCTAFFDDNVADDTKLMGIPVLGPIEKLPELIDVSTIDEVYLALAGERAQKVYPLLENLQYSGLTIRIIPDWGNLISLSSPVVVPIGSQVLFSAGDSPLSNWSAITKRLFDFTVALVMLVILFIPMLIIALLIKISSRGPAFYRQKRIGADQKEFYIVKFRTMKIGAEHDGDPQWTKQNDPRCTTIGRWLRRASIDELPQLLNVLLGQMSLVGPRPEQPYFAKQFSEEYKKYMLRHKVKAGMTGWAQVNGYRGDTSIRKRLLYDLYYVRNWSFSLDIWILLRTPVHILRGENAG